MRSESIIVNPFRMESHGDPRKSLARLMRLEELCVAANSRLVVDAMLVYFQRDTARDMQYATDLTMLWHELADRVCERDLFIVEMELLSGSWWHPAA
ncbi:hypothetical protein Tco_0282235 [Tanacetum coccineum]